MCEKIQGTYFKISALYFKIYALCFFVHALCDFSCLFSSLGNRLPIRKNGFAPDTCSFLFLSFSESGQTEKGNGTGINLTGKAFCPGNTPKRDLLNKKREKYAKIMLVK